MARVLSEQLQTVHLDAEEVRGAATDFLLDHVGNQTRAGNPQLMVSAFRTVWAVPVELTYLPMGSVGTIGVIGVDDETGQVVAWTPIDVMSAHIRELHDGLEPELSRQFLEHRETQADPLAY